MAFADIVIKVMNFILFIFYPRKVSNFRWGNSVRDAINFLGEFADGQFTKIYGRITSRYKYHPLQRYDNAIRQFDLTDSMAASMRQYGNVAFYQTVCGLANPHQQRNSSCDFTRIDDLSTVGTAADYLYEQVYRRKRAQSTGVNADKFASEAANVARTNYIRGFTRIVNVTDPGDWERLRNELRRKEHMITSISDTPEDGVTLIALSYKGKDVKITRRMNLIDDDGAEIEDSGVTAQTIVEMTTDFLDDFRWSQLVRSCVEIARREKTSKVRVWIDRLVMIGYTRKEISRRYNLAEWEEFGLFVYAVCPVVRLYGNEERYYGSDFWRKLEAVLGVAGRGLFVDDYMLRKFDETIFFGPEMYTRYENGISRIGGTGTYVRATTLALATAILTDGVSTSAVNEDVRTKRAVGRWKAWALRTIGEGAYSAEHFYILAQEDPFTVGLDKFFTITFWESMVSRSKYLTGKSYLDMSMQKSMTWRKSACWDGILEWIGMVDASCEIVEREAMKRFITTYIDIEMWTSTTGHVAAWMTLWSMDRMHKRSLVVNLSRYSTARHGHVTAVAEASGLWKGTLLPFYLVHRPKPDQDQSAEITDEGTILYKYESMKIVYSWVPITNKIAIVLGNLLLIGFSFGLWAIVAVIQLILYFREWPWVDHLDIGEALFDNLLLHSLYESGIKKQYRKLQQIKYDRIGWTGIAAQERLLRKSRDSRHDHFGDSDG